MGTLAFDSLQYARRLRAAGVPESQAEVQAELMAEAFGFYADNIVTREYLDVTLRAAFTEQDAKLEKRFTAIEQRLAGIDDRLVGFDARFVDIDQRFVDIDQRLAGFDARFGDIDQRFAGLDERFGDIDRRFTSLDQQFADLRTALEAMITGRLNQQDIKLASIEATMHGNFRVLSALMGVTLLAVAVPALQGLL